MPNLRVLYLKGNAAIRSVSNYRRNMICNVKTLTYLDDRPIKPIDRLGAEAYMIGGAQAENSARKEYADKNNFVKNVRKEEEFELNYEERKAKAMNNMRNEYHNKKETLELKKKFLMGGMFYLYSRNSEIS